MEAGGTQGPPQQHPAGWYPNPEGPGNRYWDGGQWTDNYAPAPEKPKKQRTVLKVVLGILIASFLLIGGCVALIGGAANEADKSIKRDEQKAGGTKNPMTITPGQAFEVDGFKYAAGWSVGKDSLGDVAIKGLKVTNTRSDRDSALVEIKFVKGTEVLALADCTTEPINEGTTVTLSCTSADKVPDGYDKITINDSF